ncbi:MAG TPA: hypothetical protein VMS38_14420 [Pseudorhodoferax sp.]|nr:hypothetical protein [Pseudorhodoferax sp.]
MDLAALLPWWAGVMLALLSYRFLHGLATQPLPLPAAQHSAAPFTDVVWQGLASAGQYILPSLCLLAALLSALRRRQQRLLLQELARIKSAQVLLQAQIPDATPVSAPSPCRAVAQGVETGLRPVQVLAQPAAAVPSAAPAASAEDVPAPACPRCARPMLLRVARRGGQAGRFFWRCSGSPRECQGTRTIQES